MILVQAVDVHECKCGIKGYIEFRKWVNKKWDWDIHLP